MRPWWGSSFKVGWGELATHISPPSKLPAKTSTCSCGGVTGTRSTLPPSATTSLDEADETTISQHWQTGSKSRWNNNFPTLENRQHKTVILVRRATSEVSSVIAQFPGCSTGRGCPELGKQQPEPGRVKSTNICRKGYQGREGCPESPGIGRGFPWVSCWVTVTMMSPIPQARWGLGTHHTSNSQTRKASKSTEHWSTTNPSPERQEYASLFW